MKHFITTFTKYYQIRLVFKSAIFILTDYFDFPPWFWSDSTEKPRTSLILSTYRQILSSKYIPLNRHWSRYPPSSGNHLLMIFLHRQIGCSGSCLNAPFFGPWVDERSPFGAIRTSLSLLKMLFRLASLQESEHTAQPFSTQQQLHAIEELSYIDEDSSGGLQTIVNSKQLQLPQANWIHTSKSQ